MKHIVILGGGFAGLEAAIKLRRYKYRVTLVSSRDYMFVYPVSIWIPVKKIKFDDVKLDMKILSRKHGFKFIQSQAERINSKDNTVILSQEEVSYDYLILAMGMDKLYIPGMENTLSICGKPEESLDIKESLESLVRKGSGRIAVGFGGNPQDPTATAVRGGPAFELIFNISHYLKKRNLSDKFELTFFAPMKEPGKRMGEKPFRKMDVFFKHYKVGTRVGKKIKRFESDAVVFEDDSRLESDLIIFVPGGKGLEIARKSDLPVNSAGFVVINELCRVQAHRNVFAIGDMAAITGPSWAAKQGHIAEVMADTAAYNIHNDIIVKGKRKSYWEHLNIICVMDSGDGAAIIKRTRKKEFILPLPVIGHWMKRAWGFYYKNTKMKRIPRLPGM